MSAEQREAAVQKQLAEQQAQDAARAETEARIAEADSRFRSGAKHWFLGLEENLGIGDTAGTATPRTQKLAEAVAIEAGAKTPSATTYKEVKVESARVQQAIQAGQQRIASLESERESERKRLEGLRQEYLKPQYRFDTSANRQLESVSRQLEQLDTRYQTKIQTEQQRLSSLTQTQKQIQQTQTKQQINLISEKPLYANPSYVQKGTPEYLGKSEKKLNEPEYKDRPRIQTEQPGALFGKTTFVQDNKRAEPDSGFTTAYTLSLTEGGRTPKDFGVSLSEGAPPTPKKLTQEQVNKLSGPEYAIYLAEYAEYNKYIQEKERREGLLNWREYKGDLKKDISELKEKGVRLVTIKSDEGFKTAPIDRAFYEIVKAKNVTSVAPVPELPEGYTIARYGPGEITLVGEGESRFGPDEAYTGIFKDPRKGKEEDFLTSLGRKTVGVVSTSLTGTAKIGTSLLSGIAALGLKVKGEEPIIIGNQTIPEELEQPPISAPLAQIQQTPAQKVAAISGGGIGTTERNIQSVQTYLTALEKSRSRTEARTYGEDPFAFMAKEQKKQGVFENLRDVGEGVGVGFFRTSVFLTATVPQAVIDQIQTGDFSEKATTARLQKDEEDLRKLGIGPSAIGEAMAGRGTGRSPYYNIPESLAELGTGAFGAGGPKAPRIAKPGVPMSGLTKARILTKLEASREKNIYGVEKAIEGRAATGFVSKRIEALKAKFKETKQFIGSIGTEAERDAFKPLTTEIDVGGPKVTAAKPDVTAVGPKGEKVTIKKPQIIEPDKGKPSKTPALVIDTGEKGLTGLVRAQPKETIENQIGIIMRGDVMPSNLKRLGLKQVSTDKKGVPVYAARIPKGAKKREKFFSILSEAEEMGFIKRVTDIDFIPTERALGIAKGKIGQGVKVKGRKDITLGERKESYGPRQLRNEFQTAPYYETTASMGTPRELRVKGTTEGITVEEAFRTGKLPKGKPKLEDEFGLTGVDAGLKESGLSPALAPKPKTMKGFEDFKKPIKESKGGAGRGGKLEPITQAKALEIAGAIKPLTAGTKPASPASAIPAYGGMATGSAYAFETEVTGRYTIRPPTGISTSRLDIHVTDILDTRSNLAIGTKQKDLFRESLKQTQPQLTQETVRTDTITKQGLREQQKQKSALAQKYVFREETKQLPRTEFRLDEAQKQKQATLLKQKLEVPLIPKVPEELVPKKIPPYSTIRIPEIEKRKTKREKEKEKEKIEFIGNVFEEQVTGGFRGFDIKYGAKKVSRQSALGLSISRKGRQTFGRSRSEPMLSRKEKYFTGKPKKIGRSGFAKPGKKYNW